MIKDIQAVIFDLDGSLVDSMWIWRKIDIEYLGRYGLKLPEDLQSCIEGMSFQETAEYFKITINPTNDSDISQWDIINYSSQVNVSIYK